MQIRVKLFGAEAKALGQNEISVECAQATPAGLKEALRAAYPALSPLLERCRVAVNHDFAAPDQKILAADEVALIGMVSGG